MKRILIDCRCLELLYPKTAKNMLSTVLLVTACYTLPAQSGYAFNTRHHQAILQQKKEPRVALKVKNEKLSVVLLQLEKQIRYVFVYSDDDINASQRVSLDTKGDLSNVLEALSRLTGISYEFVNDKIILRGKGQPESKTTGIPPASSLSFTPQEETVLRADLLLSGRVTDEAGAPIAGVNVTLKGSPLGATTNANGNYSLTIPDNSQEPVLLFSYIGYVNQEVAVSNRKTINVVLQKTDQVLSDVVVVGYGTQRRASVTGSVDRISNKAIEGRPVTNVSQALQGVSPNLIIQQRNFEPGQGVNINIRGLGTLGDNTPLVVIDGIPGGDINLLNPTDIENISILKDAGSAAIYGSRSANGVILITTRKGRKNEKPTVSYHGIYGVQTPRITYEPVHAWENAWYKNESLANSGLQPVFSPTQIRDLQAKGDGDWRLESILQDAAQQSHNLSISGGSANATYLLSLGYLDQQNSFIGPDYGYKRYNIRFNQTTELGRLKLNTILSYAKVQGKDHSSTAGTLIVDAGRVPLYYSMQDTAGNYLTNAVSAELNPKAILEQGGFRQSDNDEVFGNISAEYTVIKDLKIRGVFGGTLRANKGFGRKLPLTFLPGGAYGQDREVYDDNFKSLFTNLQLLAEYDKDIKQHHIKLLVGAANESYKEEMSALYKTLTDPVLGIPTTGTIIDQKRSYNTNGTRPDNRPATIETSINSLFGRAGYSYDDKYFAEFNFRYDGSSKFMKDNRWGFFPSAALAWRVTQEDFMEGFRDYVNDLKIRGSYGILGNQNVDAYQYQTVFFNYPNAYGFNNNAVGGSGYSLGNPDLTWEKAATFNIGFDATILKGKLDFSYDYFDKTTKDILYARRDVPQLFGAGFPDYNVAEVRNRGWEIKVTYNWRGRVLNQTFSANVADNLNELVSLTSGATQQVERKEEFELIRKVGYPITMYQAYRRDGYFQTLDDINKAPRFAGSTVTAGDIKFVDKNKDGVIDDKDKFIMGNPFPRYTFGFTYTAAIKGFDVSIFIQGVGKRSAMLRGELIEPFHFGYGGTMYRHQTDYWTPTNPNAKYPRLAEAGSPSNTNNYRTGSDIYLFDAAYARLKNVQVGYTIPASVTKKAHIQKARIYFTGQNLLTISKLNFFDPEITEFDNSTRFNTGANSARAYPLPVFYGGGIDITF
ncbi:TonB-dependent receptor [Paraflavitalea pollutisoli]|uniref:TonB-dependent receptor n=1 Tax=Paraflavitalea pollutisoli TaxID=3034143 RepID=UPI0023EA932B|nr:TonB-dependent receptor [Paraflavitalea sp. H1-2-19X]